MRSSLDDCCSSSFSWKYSSTHCSSNSYSFFSSSSFRNNSVQKRRTKEEFPFSELLAVNLNPIQQFILDMDMLQILLLH